jgi:hypothetical protein
MNHYLRIDEEADSYLFQELRRDEKNSLGYPFYNIYPVMIRPTRWTIVWCLRWDEEDWTVALFLVISPG